MSRLPISTADISAAAEAEFDLIRGAASIAAVAVHGLSTSMSWLLRRKHGRCRRYLPWFGSYWSRIGFDHVFADSQCL
jgi:hypothetical protein